VGEPAILAALEVASNGKGVRVEFTKVDRVISHTIYLVNGGEKIPVLESVSRTAAQPCFTELHQQGEMLFLTGADGPCHWSMSVSKGEMFFEQKAKFDKETLQLLERRYGLNAPRVAETINKPLGEFLHFDIACRLKGPVSDLSSDYMFFHDYHYKSGAIMNVPNIELGVLEVGMPIKGTNFAPSPINLKHWGSERQVYFGPVEVSAPTYPATTRWSYAITRTI
jgi:hypothetical protein